MLGDARVRPMRARYGLHFRHMEAMTTRKKPAKPDWSRSFLLKEPAHSSTTKARAEPLGHIWTDNPRLSEINAEALDRLTLKETHAVAHFCRLMLKKIDERASGY
jgi:hypothetical protein